MQKTLNLLISGFLGLLLCACGPIQNFGQGVFSELSGITGSGNVIGQRRALGKFRQIRISSGLELLYTQTDSEKYQLQIEADQNLHDLILSEVFGNTLIIRTSTRRPITQAQSKRLILVGPAFESLELRENSQARLTLQADTFNLKLWEQAQAQLSGQLKKLTLEAGDKSSVKALDLDLKTAEIQLKNQAQAEIQVNDNMNYTLTEQSRLSYRGKPVLGKVSHVTPEQVIQLAGEQGE